MKFAEYIELLSDSPLTRAKFDALLKKRGIIYEVEEGDEYDQAVMSGHFRGKRSEFQYTKPKKEQSIDAYKGFAKDILAEVEAKADKDHKHDIEDINGLSADLQAISKSINNIDDKHTNKHISYEESQKKYQAEIQSLNDKIKRLYAKPEKDYSVSDIKGLQDELTSIQTNIQDASKTITKSIATKANKDHKHNIKDIEGIDKWSKTIKSDILDEIPTIDEVKQALDNVYIKSEVYNKEEVDNKLKKAVKSVYVTETMGMGGGGGRGGIRGSITGALSDQTDLRAALNGKVSVTGIYTDPSWLSSLAWSKITSKPTTLSGYGITDGWKTTGNTGTNPATNFIGTTDAQDFVIKTNGIGRARVTSNGSVGIGTTSPTTKLEVNGSIRLSAGDVTNGIILPARGQRITIGTYGTISETLSGAGYITGNNIASSQTLNDTLTKVYSADNGAQFIGMRYDRGVWFGTGIGAGDPIETTYADSVNTRMVLGLTGNIGIGGTITNLTNMAGASVAIISNNVGVGTNTPTAKVDINSDVLRLRTAKTPTTAGASGNQGDISWDSNYIYVCTATNTWKRATLSTW